MIDTIYINYGNDCVEEYMLYLTDEKYYYYNATQDKFGVFPYITISTSKPIKKNMDGFDVCDVGGNICDLIKSNYFIKN